MVTNGTLMVKDRRGEIYNLSLDEIKTKYQTLQTLSMNRHGHEAYSFALLENVQTSTKPDGYLYKITVVNHLDIKKTLICTSDTQIYTHGNRWCGFVNPDRLKKNAVFIDSEDRVNRILSLEKIPNTGETLYDIRVMFTGNFFYNGILVR